MDILEKRACIFFRIVVLPAAAALVFSFYAASQRLQYSGGAIVVANFFLHLFFPSGKRQTKQQIALKSGSSGKARKQNGCYALWM